MAVWPDFLIADIIHDVTPFHNVVGGPAARPAHGDGRKRALAAGRPSSAARRALRRAAAYRFSRRPAAAVLATVLLAFGVAGCGGTAASSDGGGPEMTHLTVAVLPATDDAPFWLALKDGYFRREGLTVTPNVVAQSTLAIPEMVHGSVEIIGGGNYVSFFQAQAQGALNIRVIAPAGSCTADDFSVVALPRSGIRRPAALAGKAIAVGLTNSISTLTINEILKTGDLRTASVRYVAVPYPDMLTALGTGDVAAASLVEPFLSQAKASLGAEVIQPQCEGPTANLPLSGYFATAAWVRANPRTARAFARAIEKAQALADGDHAAVEKILPTYIKITPQIAAIVNLNAYPATLDAVLIQRVTDLMVSGGLLRTHLAVGPLLFR
jgi:NitT/TauT family transport system substrate-binding protein